MTKHDDLVKAYIDALDVCALVILRGSDGLSSICPGPAPGAFDTLWFAKKQHAELVLAQCPEGWVDLAPAALRDEAINAAAALGAIWRTAAEVRADAEKAVGQIVDNVERARIKGDLRRVNAGYKTYRESELSTGKKPIGYGEYLATFTRNVVVMAARDGSLSGP